MPTPSKKPTTALGYALRNSRDGRSQDYVSAKLGLTGATFSRIERGLNQPTYDTAVAIAKWLGWTIEDVYAQARTEIGPKADGGEYTEAEVLELIKRDRAARSAGTTT